MNINNNNNFQLLPGYASLVSKSYIKNSYLCSCIFLISAVCLVTARVGAAAAITPATEKPNVLMIVIDDLNDYVLEPKFNNVKTPNLDAFAEGALNFLRAYAPAPICNPSRAAVISGIAPHRSGIVDNGNAWELSEPVNNSVPLPMAFKLNGYTTLWSGKFWHGPTRPHREKLDIWWDDYVGTFDPGPFPRNPGIPAEMAVNPWLNKMQNFEMWTDDMEDLPDTDWNDTRTANETIERLGRDFEKPFFMVAGIYRPHVPFTAPRRFFDMYDRDSLQLPDWRPDDWDDIPAGVRRLVPQFIHFDKLREAGLWKDLLLSYLACISFADYNVGRILDALAESQYADNTIVVLWSDHGYHVGEKSKIEKHALWEQTTRSVFMIKTPDGNARGQTSPRTVSLLDIFPTLVDLCDLKNIPEGQLDGRSLMPLLKDPEAEWNYPAVMTYLYGNHAVRDERYRYIYYPGIGEELYDLDKDPSEFVNLANNPEYEQVKKRLATYLPTENAPPAGKRSIPGR
jgi:arylsulfatase A-like enzyme